MLYDCCNFARVAVFTYVLLIAAFRGGGYRVICGVSIMGGVAILVRESRGSSLLAT